MAPKRFDLKIYGDLSIERIYKQDGCYYDADEMDAHLETYREVNRSLRTDLESELTKLKEAQRWRKYPEEKPVAEIETRISLLAVIEFDNEFSGRKGRYVAEVYYVLYEDDVGVFYRQTGGEANFNIEHDGKRYSAKVVLWKPMPKAPEDK